VVGLAWQASLDQRHAKPSTACALAHVVSSATAEHDAGRGLQLPPDQRHERAEASQLPCCPIWPHDVGSEHTDQPSQVHGKPSVVWASTHVGASVTAAHVVGLDWHELAIQRQEEEADASHVA
jgi:hypothetical protein